MAPLSPRARKRIDLASIRYELTALGREEHAAAKTPRELARAAVRQGLAGATADQVIDAYLAARSSSSALKPHVISQARLLVRRLLDEPLHRRGRSTSPTTPEARR